jgi:hypothetical protein
VISLVLAGLSAVAYGLAPVIYRPALACTSQYRAVNVFSLFSIAAGFLLPWRAVEPFGVAAVASAALLGGVIGSWLYISAVKVGGASVGNISSSLYVVLLPLLAWKIHLAPAAALVLLGLAVASWGDEGSRRGALYGVLAAFVWAVSINSYAAAVESLGSGGALFMRGAVVFLASLPLSRGAPICKIRRLLAGGFHGYVRGVCHLHLGCLPRRLCRGVSGDVYVSAHNCAYGAAAPLEEGAGRLVGCGGAGGGY